MNALRRNAICCALVALASAALARTARAQFTAPTKEELTMTSQPEVPGAPAVYLFREEDTEDEAHSWSKYERIKVLTEKGKEYGTVEIREHKDSAMWGYTIKDIQARTIHSDGTIIPFTGKVEDKLINQREGSKTSAKIFSLPGVEVGSILEYRYKLEWYDRHYLAPTWYVQSDLFTRKAHYIWRPTREPLVTKDIKGEQITSAIAFTPLLPKGADFTNVTTSGTGINAGERGQTIMELKIQNVPPAPREEFMPPAESLDYKILFYYTPYLSGEQFWKGEGGRWSSVRDEFIGPGPKVTAAVQQIVSASGTPEQKLRELYAAVMQVENLTFKRGFTAAQDKERGIEPPRTADEVWERKAAHSDQITELFVAMARAAGFKAYVMGVTNRGRALFMPNYLNIAQLQDLVAIVTVDGKDQFFDPGAPFCPYGQLIWQHTATGGLRQIEGGTKLTTTPDASYKDTRTQRIADLNLNDRGIAEGTVKMTWTGAEALHWRETWLRGDILSLQRDLRAAMERMLPKGMDVSVAGIQNLDEYEEPFIVSFDVKGAIGQGTGKRLILPADIFEVDTTPRFPHESRQVPVYFEYPYQVTDAIRIGLPKGFSIENLPTGENLPFQKSAVYSFSTETTPSSVIFRRDFVVGHVVYPVAEYKDLRAFYSKLEAKDHDPAVLKTESSASPGN